MKILLIDQDERTLGMLRTTLMRAGHFVFVAADSNVGFRLAQEQVPDLIVMDIFLSGGDGPELLNQLKTDEITRSIPILITTATHIPPSNQSWQPYPGGHTRLLTYDSWMVKPINSEQFLRQVETLLSDQLDDQATGASILLITADNTRRQEIQQRLREENLIVHAYAALVKPLKSMQIHHPIALIIDQTFLNTRVWQDLTAIRATTPDFGLIILQDDPIEAYPEQVGKIDFLVCPPINPLYIVGLVKKLAHYYEMDARIRQLSTELHRLNNELLESKHDYLAQNTELDLVNRRLLDQHRLQDILTGMIIHDLKAPLGSLISTLQFMEIDPNNTLSPNSKAILSRGTAAGHQMLRLVETLLDERKLKNKEVAFNIEPIDFAESLEHILEVLHPLFMMYRATVESEVPNGLPNIMADSLVLQRVLENLLDNALKHSPPNEAIQIIITPHEDMLEVCVADRGDGIAPHERELVFEPFTQLNEEKLDSFKRGVGLGLAFCKLAIEAMQGKIWVDSLNDEGAAFHFTLPFVK